MKKNFYLLDETAVEELCKRLIDAEIRETLCLAQEFAPNSKPLAEALYKFQLAGLTDEEMAARFDQRDFEDANLLLWINGHGGDVLIYPKSHDAIGHEILGINQIAGSLAFLERPALSQSHPFRGGLAELSILSGAAERPPLGEEESPPFQGGVLQNPLRCLPNANQPLSFEGKTKIRALSIEALSEKLARFGLESSVDAFRERLALLKELANQPGITIRQIDTQMAKITRFG